MKKWSLAIALLSIVLALTAALWALVATGGGSSQANADVTLKIDPATQTVTMPGGGTFDVAVQGGVDVAGVAYDVLFDHAIIQVDLSSPGSFPPGCNPYVNAIDNAGGHIEFACMTAPISGENGSGTVVSYDFTCVGDGTTSLQLDLVELVDSQAELIAPVTVEPGSVTCECPDDDDDGVCNDDDDCPDTPDEE